MRVNFKLNKSGARILREFGQVHAQVKVSMRAGRVSTSNDARAITIKAPHQKHNG